MRFQSLVFVLFAGLLLASSTRGQTTFEQSCARLASRHGHDAERLQELFKLDWDHSMREDPEYATEVGYPGQNDRWTDNSLEAIARRKRELSAPLKVIQSIKRSALSPSDQLNYELFLRNQQNAIEGTQFNSEYMPITQMDGVQQSVPETLEISPRGT